MQKNSQSNPKAPSWWPKVDSNEAMSSNNFNALRPVTSPSDGLERQVQANADIVSALSGVSISDTQSEISKLESTQTVAPQPMITDRSRDRPLTEFTIFGRFPKELRLKVWDVLLQQFRLIEIEGKQVARNIKRGHNTYYTWDEMQWEDGDGPDHQKFRIAYHSRDPPVILVRHPKNILQSKA